MSLSKSSTSNTTPILLQVGQARNGRSPRVARNRPSSLSHPYPGTRLDAVDGIASGRDAVEEGVVSIIDAFVLEIRETVGANPIAGSDHIVVSIVHPRSPCIDVSDFDISMSHVPKHVPDFVDLSSKSASGQISTVEIFVADRDSNHPISAILSYSIRECLLLTVEMVFVMCPDAGEELGIGVDSCGDGGGECTTIARSVEACTGEIAI